MTPDPDRLSTAPLTRALDDVAVKLIRHGPPRTEQQALELCDRVHDTAAQFERAPIQAFVPVLVENLVRSRITVATADRPAASPGPTFPA